VALTRKQKKEFKQLKSQTENLWDDQKELFDHASHVVREASRQAQRYARQEVSPKVRDAFEDRFAPVVNSARSAASHTRDKLLDDVLPAVTSALGTALAAIEVAKNRQVRDAIARAARFGQNVGSRMGVEQASPAPKAGPGRYILIGFGVVAAIVVGYAAYQTLRADDDLWIDDEPEAVEAS
jgi:ElaB/YqjD/DUF883 family membrane-anchored ribosome-binding protein